MQTDTRDMDMVMNGIDTQAIRETADAITRDPGKGMTEFAVSTRWLGGTRSVTKVDGYTMGGRQIPKDFAITIDEPKEIFGENTAANPQEVLMAAMNACIMNTFVAHCALRRIRLESVVMETKGMLDLRGFMGLDPRVVPGYENIEYTIHVKGDGTPEQFDEVHQAVMKTSPNFWNLSQPVKLVTKVVSDGAAKM